MNLRPWLLVAHRWLGLATAPVLLVAGVTGAMLTIRGFGGRLTGLLHESLALGKPGTLVVLAVTGLAVVLQASGLWLWWRERRIRVRGHRGLRVFASDLHHSLGVLGLIVMLITCLTAVGRVAGRHLDKSNEYQPLKQAISRLHTTTGFPVAVKVLFGAGSLGIAIQGVTGFMMWRRPRR